MTSANSGTFAAPFWCFHRRASPWQTSRSAQSERKMAQQILDSHVHLWGSWAANTAHHAWMAPGSRLTKQYSTAEYAAATAAPAGEPTPPHELVGFVYVETDRRRAGPPSGTAAAAAAADERGPEAYAARAPRRDALSCAASSRAAPRCPATASPRRRRSGASSHGRRSTAARRPSARTSRPRAARRGRRRGRGSWGSGSWCRGWGGGSWARWWRTSGWWRC